jgi:uncharacterized membrane protein YpjA
MGIFEIIERYITNKRFILILAIANLLGAILGFFWYKNQLFTVPKHLWLFVADSPLATLFFAIFLFLYYFDKKVPFMEALASITIFKYGIWAIVIIIWGAWNTEASIIKMLMVDTLSWLDILLIFTHLIMAAQAIVFFRKYSYGFLSIFLVGIWIFFNDILDYALNIYPWLNESLYGDILSVAKFTLLLSGTTLLIFYLLSLLRRKLQNIGDKFQLKS